MFEKNSNTSDWKINFRKKIKPGVPDVSPLNDPLTVQLQLDENEDEDSESATLNLKVLAEEKAIFELKVEKKKRPRFKAGTELTSKVNFVDVEWSQEGNESEDVLFIGILLTSKVSSDAPSEN